MKNVKQHPASFLVTAASQRRAPVTPLVWRPGSPAQALQAKTSAATPVRAAAPMVKSPPAFRPFSSIALQRHVAVTAVPQIAPVPPAFQPNRRPVLPTSPALVQRSAAKSVNIYSSASRGHNPDVLEQATNDTGYGARANGRTKYSGHGSQKNGAGVSGATTQANKVIMERVHEIEHQQYLDSRPKATEYITPKTPDLEKALKRGHELMVEMVRALKDETMKSETQAVANYTSKYTEYLGKREYDGEVVDRCMAYWKEGMENYDEDGNLAVLAPP